MNNSIDEYNSKMGAIILNCEQNKYIFEMTKCCGYSFMFPVYKLNTLEEFFHNIVLEFYPAPILRIFLQNEVGEQLEIPINSTTIMDFLNANKKWFVPIYPLPAKVVYRVYFDDGHAHSHNT